MDLFNIRKICTLDFFGLTCAGSGRYVPIWSHLSTLSGGPIKSLCTVSFFVWIVPLRMTVQWPIAVASIAKIDSTIALTLACMAKLMPILHVMKSHAYQNNKRIMRGILSINLWWLLDLTVVTITRARRNKTIRVRNKLWERNTKTTDLIGSARAYATRRDWPNCSTITGKRKITFTRKTITLECFTILNNT